MAADDRADERDGRPLAPTRAVGLMAAGARVVVRLRSTAGTGTTYVTTKNRQTQRGRLELRKYDKRVQRHVLFREER